MHFTKLATDIPLSNLGIQKVDGNFTEGPRYTIKITKKAKKAERILQNTPISGKFNLKNLVAIFSKLIDLLLI